MRSMNDTITRLTALGQRPIAVPGKVGRLDELGDFGPNPGALRALCHVPAALADGAPLVVVLHGCTQTAAGYDRGSGWSELADALGFAVLFPEQQRANNANLCFNWFDRDDIRRGAGEALSIRQMVAAMVDRHRLDPARVFVTGLSAGGAMASAMLATYPEVFAGGAIVAGLPFGTAASMPEAFDRMRAHGGPRAADLGAIVAAASDHAGPWPIVSVWHGGADATVSPANAGLIVEQWRALHGVPAEAGETQVTGRDTRRVWRDAGGRAVIEEHTIAGLGHGTPLSTSGADGCGVAGPYMLEAGVSSTREIARFWGLDRAVADRDERREPMAVDPDRPVARDLVAAGGARPAANPPATRGITKIIEDALRTAGLMR